MDNEDAGAQRDVSDEQYRPPKQEDVAALCRELNRRGGKYGVVGGFWGSGSRSGGSNRPRWEGRRAGFKGAHDSNSSTPRSGA
jgi:hypothetical protein